MEPDKLKAYEHELRALLTELGDEIDKSREERAPVAVDGRMGRVSRGDALQAQQMAVEAGRRRQQRIIRVRAALDRIRDGTYGHCARCQRPIGEARLEAMPDVVLCVQCAGRPGPR